MVHLMTNITSLSTKLRPLSPLLHYNLMTISHLQQQQHHPQQQQLHSVQVYGQGHTQGSHSRHQQLLHVASAIATTEKESTPAPPSSLVVVSFYKFADLPDYPSKRLPLKELCEELVSLLLTF